MLQLTACLLQPRSKIPRAAAKTWCNQILFFFLKQKQWHLSLKDEQKSRRGDGTHLPTENGDPLAMGCLHPPHLVPQLQISRGKGSEDTGLFVGVTIFCTHPPHWAGPGLDDLSQGNNPLWENMACGLSSLWNKPSPIPRTPKTVSVWRRTEFRTSKFRTSMDLTVATEDHRNRDPSLHTLFPPWNPKERR